MLARIGMIALAYFVAARFGLFFVVLPEGLAGIWPASGVALASLLLNERRTWPGILGAIFAVNLFSNLMVDNSVFISACFAFANTLEPLAFAGLMRHFLKGTITFTRLFEVFNLLAIAFLANAFTALVGAVAPVLGFGTPFWRAWLIWWIADGLGILIITPIIIVWFTDFRPLSTLSVTQRLEIGLMFVVLGVVSWMTFGVDTSTYSIELHPYMLFIFLSWAAWRYNLRGATGVLGVISIIALGTTVAGIGNFPLGGETPAERLISIQTFLVIAASGELILAAIIAERWQGEEVLAKSEKRFRALVEHSTDAFGLLRADGSVFYEGPMAPRFTGYSIEERMGKSGLGLIHPDDLPSIQATFADVQAHPGSTASAEFRSVRKDGTIWWTEASATNLLHDPDVRAIVVNYRDVTERKLAEQALAESEKKYRTLVEAADDAILMTDLQGEYIFANSAYYTNLGYKVGDDLNQHTIDTIHPDDLSMLYQKWGELLAYGVSSAEYRIRHQDGSWRYRFARSTLIYDEEGSPKATLAIIRDITDRKQAEDLLSESEKRFRALVEHSADAITLLDADGKVIYEGPTVPRVTGFTAEERVGMSALGNVYPEDLPVVRATLGEILEKPGANVTAQFRSVRKDGSIWWTEGTATNLLHDPNVRAIVVNYHDITERKQAEIALQEHIERLQKMQVRLVQSEKLAAIGELVAGIAHELNNPLTSVVLNAQLMQMHTLPVSMQHNLEKIVMEAQRAGKIVRGLLEFARKRPSERKWVQVNDVLQSSLELLNYELTTRNVQMNFHLDEHLPVTLVDPYQLQQVFVNIVNNAWQAMGEQEERRMHISTEFGRSLYDMDDQANAAQVVRIRVQDNGPGIAPEMLVRIFDPFFTTKEPGEGTGLGLSICHGIITEHRGHIWVESEVGEGATFFIELPLTDEAGVVVEPVKVERSSGGVLSEQPVSILVIDDEIAILDAVSSVLRDRGHRVITSLSAFQGLELLRTDIFDLILCDIRMPGMDGMEFFKELQARYPKMSKQILFTTGDSVSSNTRDFLDGIHLPCLHKPFDLKELMKTVSDLLAQKNL